MNCTLPCWHGRLLVQSTSLATAAEKASTLLKSPGVKPEVFVPFPLFWWVLLKYDSQKKTKKKTILTIVVFYYFKFVMHKSLILLGTSFGYLATIHLSGFSPVLQHPAAIIRSYCQKFRQLSKCELKCISHFGFCSAFVSADDSIDIKVGNQFIS